MSTNGPTRLFFIHMPGCPGCDAMKPVVRKFHEKHPAIRIVPFDLTREEWRADAWTPTMTPSFILLFPNGKWVYREGVEGEKSFMAWIETHLDAAREEA